MISLFRQRSRLFLLTTILAVAVRLAFIVFLPFVEDDDTLFYSEIAKNILVHHQYAQNDEDGLTPTLVRLPGYPAFLAANFWLFGVDKYTPVLIVQLVFDVGTCVLMADLARRIFGTRSAYCVYILAALCPFTANYASTALTECLELFFIVLAFHQLLFALDSPSKRWPWLTSGIATACAIMLRPDGGVVLICLVLLGITLALRRTQRWKELVCGLSLLSAISIAPLIPWTIRNWEVFHILQPMVSVSASNPGEFSPTGWGKWLKTWLSDSSQIVNVAWKLGSDDLDIQEIPRYAFDSQNDYDRINKLLNEYNTNDHAITPEWDARFGMIADEQFRRHPIRCYVALPLIRTLDMWFHPRTEALQLGSHGWDGDESIRRAITISLWAVNFIVVMVAAISLYKSRGTPYLGILWLFPLVRSLFLASTGFCEQRYTIECMPFVLILAGNFLSIMFANRNHKTSFVRARTIR